MNEEIAKMKVRFEENLRSENSNKQAQSDAEELMKQLQAEKQSIKEENTQLAALVQELKKKIGDLELFKVETLANNESMAKNNFQQKTQAEIQIEQIKSHFEQVVASKDQEIMKATQNLQLLSDSLTQKNAHIEKVSNQLLEFQNQYNKTKNQYTEALQNQKQLTSDYAQKLSQVQNEYAQFQAQSKHSKPEIQTIEKVKTIEKEIPVEKIVEKIIYKDSEETLRLIETLKAKNNDLRAKLKQLEEQSATFDLTQTNLTNLASSNILKNLDEPPKASKQPKEVKSNQDNQDKNDNTESKEREKLIGELQNKISQLEKKNSELASDLETAKNSKITTVQAFKQKIDSLNDKIYELKNEQRMNAQSNQTRDSQLDISQLADRDLSEELFRLESENKELRRLQKKRQIENTKRIESLQNQVAEFESKQDDWQYVTSAGENKRVEKMRDRLKAKITQIGSLNTELTELKSENAQLKIEKAELQQNIDTKYKFVAEMMKESNMDMTVPDKGLTKEKYGKAVSYIVQKNKILTENYRKLQESVKNGTAQGGTVQGGGDDPQIKKKLEELDKENKTMIEENQGLQIKLMEQIQLINDLNSREFLYRKLLRKHNIKPP